MRGVEQLAKGGEAVLADIALAHKRLNAGTDVFEAMREAARRERGVEAMSKPCAGCGNLTALVVECDSGAPVWACPECDGDDLKCEHCRKRATGDTP